jgi:hypothetical protein
MNITDILGNLPKENSNDLSTKISKNSEKRRIQSRIQSYITDILNFLGEENKYIRNGLSYSFPDRPSTLSDEDKKELTNFLVSEIKSLPEKLKTEVNSFFEDVSKDEDKKEESSVSATIVKAPESIGSVFGY